MRAVWVTLFLFFIPLHSADNMKTVRSIVIDTQESLVWQDNREAVEDIWKMANAYCKQLHLNNSDIWRLPTKEELIELSKNQNLKQDFVFLQKGVYWSSEIDKNDEFSALTVYTGNGFVSSSDKCEKYFVMCVRDLEI